MRDRGRETEGERGPTVGLALSDCSPRAPRVCVQSPRGPPTCRSQSVSQSVSPSIEAVTGWLAGLPLLLVVVLVLLHLHLWLTPRTYSGGVEGEVHLLDLRHHGLVLAQRVHNVLERGGPVRDGRRVDRRGDRVGEVLRGVVGVGVGVGMRETRVRRGQRVREGVRGLLGGGLGEDAEDAGDVGVHGGLRGGGVYVRCGEDMYGI